MTDESSLERPERLGTLLGPAAGAFADLPAHVREPLGAALDSVAPVMELLDAEATVMEHFAERATVAGAEETARSDRVVDALRELETRESVRWAGVQARLAHLLSEESEPDAAEVARMLAVDGPAADAEEFDRFMRDSDNALVLPGPRPTFEPDHATRLSTIGRRTDHKLELSADQLTQLEGVDRLSANGVCGTFARYDARVFLGLAAGVWAEVRDHRLLPSETAGGEALAPRVSRLASDTPPVLAPAARAALGSCLMSRDATVPVTAQQFPAWLTVGVPLAAEPPESTAYLALARRLSDFWRSLRSDQEGNFALAAALLAVSYEIQRIRFVLVASDDETVGLPLIDLGRIRWCELSARPVTWLPLWAPERNQVGGGDRPWTWDAPATGSSWHGTSPALRLDTSWSSAVVFVPGDPTLYAVDPTGEWWDLGSDFEGVLYGRAAPLEPFRDAAAVFEEEIPQVIANLRAADQRPTGSVLEEAREPEELENSAAFLSREWLQAVAGRYEYEEDSAAREAGRRASERGYYDRDGFLTVVAWKATRAVPRAERNDASAIEQAAAAAFRADDEIERVTHLMALEGVGIPIASALLHFAFPDRYPILDYRALATLGETRRRTQYSPQFWADYLARVRSIAADAGVPIRMVDKALWQASREADRGRTAVVRPSPRSA